MSRRALGSSSGTYHVRASELARDVKSVKSLRCIVFFLDDTQHTFDLEKRSKGQVLFDLVFRQSELVEKDYFGLQFSEKASAVDGMRWLDPVKCIKKQIKVGPPYLLYFRVKFYVSDPSKLQEEWTRYYFFLQLKKDILEGRLVIPPATAALLASYAVQSELGDYNPDDHKHGYLADMRLVPHQTEELEEKIAELHKLHKGQNSADAEFNFLEHAKRLDMYGVDLHKARVRDSTQAELQLGVTSYGLVVFQNSIRINTFSWAKIVKISFKRKQFFIQLRREGTESYDNLLGFNMLSYRSCKNLWKSCVEHHTFFRLNTPRPTTKRFLFSLGSKFRYSGRTEYQTLEDMKKRGLDDRPFLRSPSKRCVRQTVPTPTEPREKKPSKSIPRMNGTSNSHVRPYDSFSHKVQISGPEYLPRKAWAETPLSEVQAFTPAIPPKMIRYADDDSLPELILEFIGCPWNLAANRQTRMLADLSLVGCYNRTAVGAYERDLLMLTSAKDNLRRMAFFGLTERQQRSQRLFERTFRLRFLRPFAQLNETRSTAAFGQVGPEELEAVKRLNHLDLQLYEYAKKLMDDRIRRLQATQDPPPALTDELPVPE